MNKYKTEEITIRECELLNEMKDNCLNGGQYIDNNAKEKFKMLCHLEDFSIQYYNLIEVIDKAIEYINSAIENEDIEELKSARHLLLYNEDLDKLLEILKEGDKE